MGKKIKTVKEWLNMKKLKIKLQKRLESMKDEAGKNSIAGIIDFLNKKMGGKS